MEDEQKALKVALRFLKVRPRSIFEVRRKLKEKKCNSEIVEKVISKLVEQKLLDDQKFARSWIGFRENLRPTGLRLLRLELKKFGIAEEILQNVLKPQQDSDFQLQLALKAAEKKKKYLQLSHEEYFQKMSGFLARRGFDWPVIEKAIKKIKNKS